VTSPTNESLRSEVHFTFRSPAGIAVIAAAVMGLVALGFILLPRSGTGPIVGDEASPTASTTQEATPTAAPTATVVPTPTSAPTPTPVAQWTGLAWSDPVTPSFTVHLNDVLPWGDGYVAVGLVDVDATRSEAAFLSSSDGLHWTINDQHDPGIDRYPRHLVALGDELFAFSHRATTEGLITGAPPGTYYGPLIWSSIDGVTWTRVDSATWQQAWTDARVGPLPSGWDVLQYEITTGLAGVASGPDGLVAIGNSYSADGLIPVLLRSTDGRTWTSVSLPADSASPLLNAVVPFDDGFVLVGAVEAGPRMDTAMPAAWLSSDGRTWTGTTIDDAGSEFGRVVSGADGLLAWQGSRVMHSGPRFSGFWSSPDGLTWSPTEVPAGLFGLVAGDGTRIVALGPMPNLATDPALWPGISQGWVSTDGVEWASLAMSSVVDDFVEGMWVVPDGVIYAGQQSFWFGAAHAAE